LLSIVKGLILKKFPSFLRLLGWFWNFTKGVSKNWHIDVRWCPTTSLHRHVLNCHVDDVISILQKKLSTRGLLFSLIII
jgi:hypothetical protein